MSKKSIFLAVSIFLVAGISLFFYIRKNNEYDSVRRIFVFESYDTAEKSMEIRYLHNKDGEEAVREFVEELLLGPETDRYIRLFPYGTKLLSCFIRDGVLYTDFSEEAALSMTGTSDTETACALLRENVMRNFSGLKDYRIFMMGNEVYASGTTFGADS